MLPGYNTNGFAHHDLLQAIDVLGELGYRSIALTLDHGSLNPFDPGCGEQLAAVARRLEHWSMRTVVETGARYLLDPRIKHEPTLVTADPQARRRRIDFLCRALDIAADLGSDCVSCWSGIVRDGAAETVAMQRLLEGLEPVLEHASRRQVPLGFEPEPGMLIDTMARFAELDRQVDTPLFQLTLDVGHLHCLGELPIADQILRWAGRLVNVHLEDMRRGVHEHLMFGEGEMVFGPVLQALADAGYRGGLHVELSRHSHAAPQAAEQAIAFLRANWPAAVPFMGPCPLPED